MASPKEFTPYNSRKLLGMRVLKNNHKLVRALRKEHGYPTHHGNKVWKSSIVLMDYLRKNPPPKKGKVLEVGCGWAIGGLYCAKKWSCDVHGLDIDPTVLPFAQLHADINGVPFTPHAKSYQSAKGPFLKPFDCVVGSDICFWDELSELLLSLTKRSVKAGCRVVITDPGRSPFLTMAKKVEKLWGTELIPWAVGAPYDVSGWVLDVNLAPATKRQSGSSNKQGKRKC